MSGFANGWLIPQISFLGSGVIVGLSISGVELTVERRWLREAFWRQARQAVQHGYVYRSSAVAMTVRADRRERDRH